MKKLIHSFLLPLMVTSGVSRAAVLINGDFEISGAGNPTFNGWGEFLNDTLPDVKTTSAIVGGSTISGTASAEIVALATNGGAIRQTVPAPMSRFTVTLGFASLSPDATADATTRYFSMQLKHGAATSTTQINLRVAKSGQLQAYDGANWQAVGSLMANFTTDAGTLGAWGG